MVKEGCCRTAERILLENQHIVNAYFASFRPTSHPGELMVRSTFSLMRKETQPRKLRLGAMLPIASRPSIRGDWELRSPNRRGA